MQMINVKTKLVKQFYIFFFSWEEYWVKERKIVAYYINGIKHLAKNHLNSGDS